MGINTLRRLDSGAIKSVSLNWHTLDMHLIQELKFIKTVRTRFDDHSSGVGVRFECCEKRFTGLSSEHIFKTANNWGLHKWLALSDWLFPLANLNSFLWNTFFQAWNPSSETRYKLRSSTQELNCIRVGVVQTSLLIEKRQKKKHEHRNTSVLPRRIWIQLGFSGRVMLKPTQVNGASIN